MNKASYVILFVVLAVIVFLIWSPRISGKSDNQCGSSPRCHGTLYYQYLDILEGDSTIPSTIDVGETKTVSIVVENSGNTGKYSMLSNVSVTLTSQSGHFSVNFSSTYSIGDLQLGKKTATFQITGTSEGFDSLSITARGDNKEHVFLTFSFSDSYSNSIIVGHPAPTPTPTANPLSIQLTSPSEGEQWMTGTVQDIKWNVNGGVEPLTITLKYSTSGVDGPWAPIATGISNNGSLTWTTPNTIETVYIRAVVTDSANLPQTASAIRSVEINGSTAEAPVILIAAISIPTIAILTILYKRRPKRNNANESSKTSANLNVKPESKVI